MPLKSKLRSNAATERTGLVNRTSFGEFFRQSGTAIAAALDGDAELWKVWWLGGVPITAFAYWLGLTAESFRYDEAHFAGAILDTLKFLLCLMWLTVAWRCSENVRKPAWSGIAKAAIVVSVLLVGLTY